MADISTPNMSLTLPTISQTVGPTYAVEINNDLSILDGHNHTPGSGVQIPSSGLNINADLSFNNVNATTLRSTRFSSQSSVLSLGTDLRCLYSVSADLYYNDGSGNNIRLTQSGGVAGSPGSISGLNSPASATYNAGTGTFIWQSNTNTPANLDAGSVILRNNVASSNGLTLSPPSLGSNYTLTLPTLPTSQSLMTVDNLGNMSAPALYPITFTGIAFGGVIRLNLAPVGQIVSSTVTSSSVVKPSGPFIVGSVSATISTSGRPVMLMTQPAPGTILIFQSDAARTSSDTTGYSPQFTFEYLRNGASVGSWLLTGGGPSPLTVSTVSGAPCLITSFPTTMAIAPPTFLDTPSAGTYTYQVRVTDSTIGSSSFSILNMRIMAYEL